MAIIMLLSVPITYVFNKNLSNFVINYAGLLVAIYIMYRIYHTYE